MANSRFEYVKSFELGDSLLPGCWIVIRLDGRGFTKFSSAHGFEKPNDERALNLMNACAMAVMEEFGDIRIAYGESDEYSFAFHKTCTLYGRRASKLVSLVTSCFTANYALLWPKYFEDVPLQSTPMFDGRAVCYPNDDTLRDYFSWRQADTHVNNQYNTCFWALVKDGLSTTEAQRTLKGTQTKEKNEMLFERFGVNYNNLPEMFKKGSIVIRIQVEKPVKTLDDGSVVTRRKRVTSVLHEDLIAAAFWHKYPHIIE
uniref:tRNA(His) guanylyltransferase n=2 Tax=Tetraselmis chuii TaxID=63592 RepID=A0A6U1IC41_9CHLO|mmetsp:Transcript_30185/g.53986  ORF Transcript_30185/g.53986 Transcript_30185/m.53986 type:complete len:258 (+) Transcript_30185:198-971(+)|eukprot:CAMPEP_0177756626 /NCGR_PEP_ID=MMETSP0491_2-20121128/3209_1 /TAXON_ID=63592 /ORGANISM="Tetraselmis chuii, Strain PLY429" /LENGTH=257 /DNA_ID=CAMNT_0019272221 /DNA_START=198 /DNA_END=971 /DNA_ORIENTATION=-